MAIYFVQHGIAKSKEEDTSRPLSSNGKEESEKVASYLSKQSLNIKKVYHSGKNRAVMTAEILSRYITGSVLLKRDDMAPNDDPIEFVSGIENDNSVYVGHLPQLERVISYLVTGSENDRVIKMVNSGVVCVDQQDKHYYIKWFITPELVTKL